jgi:hypothetical protein
MINFQTAVEEGVSALELASLEFDQWILSISIRKYFGEEVVGMAKIVFSRPEGFRYLDEGDMLRYPFPREKGLHYLHEIEGGGWLAQELQYGNSTLLKEHREFLIATPSECVCVISPDEPILLPFES